MPKVSKAEQDVVQQVTVSSGLNELLSRDVEEVLCYWFMWMITASIRVTCLPHTSTASSKKTIPHSHCLAAPPRILVPFSFSRSCLDDA